MPERRVAFLRVDYTPTEPDLYVDIASANGRSRSRTPRRPFTRIKAGIVRSGPGTSPSVQQVDLTFAIHRSRKLEFRVRPEFVSTNAHMNKP